MNKLKDKVVIVTGGSGLLGSAFISAIVSNGGLVVNSDLQCAKDLDKNQYCCDITDENSIKELINAVVSKFGKIDGWVNNAYPRTTDWGKEDFASESIESWKKNVDMHLGGYAMCCQQVLNQMKKQGSGSLINMASIYGIIGPDFTVYEGTAMKNASAYAAIKGGLINLTRFLASFYGPSNVRVNSVSPGGIFDNQNPIFVEKYSNKTPLKRMGFPADIAPSVVFLLSDDASYITGHNLVIDGGWSVV